LGWNKYWDKICVSENEMTITYHADPPPTQKGIGYLVSQSFYPSLPYRLLLCYLYIKLTAGESIAIIKRIYPAKQLCLEDSTAA